MSISKNETPLIIVDNLKKYYPVKGIGLFNYNKKVHAVDGISFEIREGETFGIVGESGCGKSTIGRQLVALEKPSSGRILFNGQDFSEISKQKLYELRTQFQMVFQDSDSSLNPRKQIYDILAAPMIHHNVVSKANLDGEINRILDLVGLSRSTKSRYPHEFSGGQRQRIGIAKALSLHPKFIVCDEPVSALDVSVQAQILNLLKELQEELKLTYLFIGHGLGAVRYVSDKIAVMYLGKIVEIADSESLFANPMHPYSRALFDASPIANPSLRDRKRIVLSGEIPSAVNPPKGCRFHPRCPYAVKTCREIEPELRSINLEGDHLSACPVLIDKEAVEKGVEDNSYD